jgi:histone H3/H4
MFFRPSLRLFRRWTEECDSKLMEVYEKYGPAWSFLASQLPGRNGMECRRRWLHLSGTLEAERFEADKKLWLDGYERITLPSTGQKGWIRVPDVEKIPENPFERIAKHLPKFKTSWMKKRAGWSEIELMALREAYEQFIVPLEEGEKGEVEEEKINQIWAQIAKRFSRRTGPQCRNFFHKQHIFWDSENKIKKVLQQYEKTE